MIIKSKHLLEQWQDAIGKLVNIHHDLDLTYLTFDGLGTDVVLISPNKDVINFLESMIGHRVGVLRTNIPGKEYCYRILDGSSNKTLQNERTDPEKIFDGISNSRSLNHSKCSKFGERYVRVGNRRIFKHQRGLLGEKVITDFGEESS